MRRSHKMLLWGGVTGWSCKKDVTGIMNACKGPLQYGDGMADVMERWGLRSGRRHGAVGNAKW